MSRRRCESYRNDQLADCVDVHAAAARFRSDHQLVEKIAPELGDVQLDALDLEIRGEREERTR